MRTAISQPTLYCSSVARVCARREENSCGARQSRPKDVPDFMYLSKVLRMKVGPNRMRKVRWSSTMERGGKRGAAALRPEVGEQLQGSVATRPSGHWV